MKQNVIHCGDSRELLREVDKDSVRLIHTSPPYNIDRGYNAYSDSQPRREYLAFIEGIIQDCYRALLPGGSFFWQTGYTSESDSGEFIFPLDHLTFDLFLRTGFRLRDRIIWRYYGGMAFKRKFTNKHETVLWWIKPGADAVFDVFPVREKSKEYDSRNNLFGRNPGNVWEVDRVAFGSTEQTSHIAVFPEQISDRIVLSASRPEDLCLDPFSGSGTLCKVARSRGRRYIGIEIDKKYHEESVVRLGFCQSNEFDNILSQILKDFVFSRNCATMDLFAITERAIALLKRDWSFNVFERLTRTEFESIVEFDESEVKKERKPELWRGLDSFFDSPSSNNPLRLVDSAYLNAYRLNSAYNGVMRLALAYRWLREFGMMNADDLSQKVMQIAEAEHSSFQISGKSVTLNNYSRDIRVANGAKLNGKKQRDHQEALAFSND